MIVNIKIRSRVFPLAKAASQCEKLSPRSSSVTVKDMRCKQLLRRFEAQPVHVNVYWTGSLFWFCVFLITRNNMEQQKEGIRLREEAELQLPEAQRDNTQVAGRKKSVFWGEASVEMKVTAARLEEFFFFAIWICLSDVLIIHLSTSCFLFFLFVSTQCNRARK